MIMKENGTQISAKKADKVFYCEVAKNNAYRIMRHVPLAPNGRF
jgi:hypothetical protein